MITGAMEKVGFEMLEKISKKSIHKNLKEESGRVSRRKKMEKNEI